MHRLSKLPAGNLPTNQPSHAPYWILPTRQVNDFVTANISRWVHCLEAIITTADAAMNGSITTPQEEQLVNGVMVSALVRILCMVCGAGPAFYGPPFGVKARGNGSKKTTATAFQTLATNLFRRAATTPTTTKVYLLPAIILAVHTSLTSTLALI